MAILRPDTAIVRRDVADVHALPSPDSELVDQVHYGQSVALLGERNEWRYVQGADEYFGWVALDDIAVFTAHAEKHVVAVLLADVRVAPRKDAEVIARLPAGTSIPAGEKRPDTWRELHLGPGWRTGYVARARANRPATVPSGQPRS